MSSWDIALIVVVSIMGTAVAYLRHPEHKAFMVMIPVPFTLATLALGRPVDATNVLAAGVLFVFSFMVWLLHARRRWPIIPVIVICAAGYCAAGTAIAGLHPASDAAFWGSSVLMFTIGLILIRLMPYREEPHHSTPLPVWIKLPAVAVVISTIVVIKQHLGGFTTMFPMVGVVAAYEARKSLWTIARRIPWLMVIMVPAMSVIRLTQHRFGMPTALLLAWLIILSLLWTLRKHYSYSDV